LAKRPLAPVCVLQQNPFTAPTLSLVEDLDAYDIPQRGRREVGIPERRFAGLQVIKRGYWQVGATLRIGPDYRDRPRATVVVDEYRRPCFSQNSFRSLFRGRRANGDVAC